jgi:ATP-dependent helicase/nuclease subunit A
MSAPHDAAARADVRERHDASLFIEAGAGTGKTTALVDRVVALVADGAVELRHLAAITFTEAAAAELRDRVRAGLEVAAAGGDHRYPGADAQERCRGALHQLDEAALTTLHGFASRLLTEHPFDLGLPPGFRVLEPIEASVDFEQRWSAFVDELFDDATLDPVLTVWLASGLTVARLRPVALAFCEHHDRVPAAAPPRPIPPLRADDVVAAIDAMLRLRDAHCRDDADLLATHIDTYRRARDLLAGAADELDVFEALDAVPRPRGRGRKDCWDDVESARAAVVEVERVRSGVVDEQRRAALSVLTGRLSAFAHAYADDRRRDGRLWFHDLLVFARDLLREHPDARDAAASRYRCLLIDEFQDTDPLQIELAVLLATSDPAQATRRWTDAPIRDGALTLVGDPKQAIYRFRNADLRVFDEARRSLGLEPVALVENFRSVPAILDAVNAAFGELLVERPGVQPAHVTLHPHRPSAPDARVAVVGEAADQPMVEVREHEAEDVAGVIRQILDEGWPVEDPDGGVRPAVARDIALLIPTRTVLPALEAALELADVPVRVESQSLVYSTAEVRDLLHVLAAVDDPTDEIAVVAALRSPAYGCSDAALATHAGLGGRWDYRRDPPEDSPAPVVDGLASLRGLWRMRWWRTVSGTVDAVVRERRLLELAARHRRPRDHWRRIRFLLDQSRAWEDAGETSLRGFVEWAARQADEGARVNEAVAPEPDDPAVRILTVHGAKGLEFPIVVLAGLNTLPSKQPPTVLWGADGAELRVGVKTADRLVVTEGYDGCLADERAREEAERRRLLYVAMTRARDHLVVSLHHKQGSNECHAAALVPHLADLEVLTPTAVELAPRDVVAPMPASADPTARDAWIARRSALLARASVPTSVAATALATADDRMGDDVDERPPWRRGRAGTAIGRAVHAVLQTTDLGGGGADLAVIARAQAFAEGVPDRADEVRALAASVLAAPVVRDAAKAGWPCWRELPVGAVIDGVLLEGFVDLLVRTPDGLVVVDYKTDQAPDDAAIDAAAAHYAPQGSAYALALQEVLREEVVGCVFVFARSTTAVERSITDLAGAVQSVRAQLQRPLPALDVSTGGERSA